MGEGAKTKKMPLLYYFNVLVREDNKQKVLLNQDVSTLNEKQKREVIRALFLKYYYHLIVRHRGLKVEA